MEYASIFTGRTTTFGLFSGGSPEGMVQMHSIHGGEVRGMSTVHLAMRS
jgi:hypothetical protein